MYTLITSLQKYWNISSSRLHSKEEVKNLSNEVSVYQFYNRLFQLSMYLYAFVNL